MCSKKTHATRTVSDHLSQSFESLNLVLADIQTKTHVSVVSGRRLTALDQNVVVVLVPGHSLHEKGVQRQIGVGTLVSNKERRAAVVPRINRLSTAG